MTLHELERKLVELDELRTELKSTIDEVKSGEGEKPKPPHPRWIPKECEFYYYISDTRGIYIDSWHSDDIDKFRFSTGNVFRRDNVFQNSAEAEFAIERMKVLAEMREWAGNYNDIYFLFYDVNEERIRYLPATEKTVYGEMRFATNEDAKNCIEAVGGDRIKKYYFMIPEDEEGE